MAEQWFFTNGGQRHGPVSYEDLKRLAAARQLQPTDSIWKEGYPSWIPASSDTNLFGSAVAPAWTGQQPPPPPGEPGRVLVSSPPRDPILMAVLSFMLPPLGQFLLGQKAKAISMFFLAPLLLVPLVLATIFLLPLYNIVMALDAFFLTRKLQRNGSVGQWEFFGTDTALQRVKLAAIVMLVVAIPTALLSFYGVTRFNKDIAWWCLSLIQNGVLCFGAIQMLRVRSHPLAIAACVLVMLSWFWIFVIASGSEGVAVVFGLTFYFLILGIFGLVMLFKPEVKAAFQGQDSATS